ANTLSDNSIRT
ncbi:hypothetical protein D043_1905B, partial [Vibrio parahaemolyticus EKP-021]